MPPVYTLVKVCLDKYTDMSENRKIQHAFRANDGYDGKNPIACAKRYVKTVILEHERRKALNQASVYYGA